MTSLLSYGICCSVRLILSSGLAGQAKLNSKAGLPRDMLSAIDVERALEAAENYASIRDMRFDDALEAEIRLAATQR